MEPFTATHTNTLRRVGRLGAFSHSISRPVLSVVSVTFLSALLYLQFLMCERTRVIRAYITPDLTGVLVQLRLRPTNTILKQKVIKLTLIDVKVYLSEFYPLVHYMFFACFSVKVECSKFDV